MSYATILKGGAGSGRHKADFARIASEHGATMISDSHAKFPVGSRSYSRELSVAMGKHLISQGYKATKLTSTQGHYEHPSGDTTKVTINHDRETGDHNVRIR